MTPARPILLLTRPPEPSRELADPLAARGFDSVIAPAIEIVPLPFTLPRPLEAYAALIFTSANAVRSFAGTTPFRAAPAVHAVGAQTADCARAFGFQNVTETGPDSAALARFISGHRPGDDPSATRIMLHPRGQEVVRDLSSQIDNPALRMEEVVCYRAQDASALPPRAVDLLKTKRVYAALFFSARSAQAFLRLADAAGCTPSLSAVGALCLSPRVVESARTVSWREIRVAGRPDRDGMLALLEPTGTGGETRP